MWVGGAGRGWAGRGGFFVCTKTQQARTCARTHARTRTDRLATVCAQGIGHRDRNDGVLYALALRQRSHHLFAGAGMLGDLGDSQRKKILDGLRPHLRAKDVDGAVTQVAAGGRWRAWCLPRRSLCVGGTPPL